ncbi:MAG: protein translocase subunit SecF [Steroidobacteraceae bacterium]
MNTRRIWYAVSAILIIGSLVSLAVRGLNLGIDFTGGVVIEAAFKSAPDLEAVRADLARGGFAEAQVRAFGTSRDIEIRLPPLKDQTSKEVRDGIESVLRTFDKEVEIRRVDVVGPQIGKELQSSALLALVFTLLFIFIYVALRFHTWRLSVGAILAALHDPILVLGVFSATQLSFDLSVVAAVLAVIGYSLNDTVVVFDRIRERFESNRRSPSQQVLDQSINQTLSRTIMTSGTTLLVVIVLLVFGGAALTGFAAALVVGMVVGTYSSIYVASAIALDFGLTAEHLFPTAKKSAIDDMP